MTQTCIGWIIDVYIENDQAVLWIKTDDGKALRLTDEYAPEFYIQPKNEKSGNEIIQILSDLELISKIKWDYKFIDISNPIKKKLIHVCCYTIGHYDLLLKVLQHETLLQRIQQLFNTRLSHIQRYLFKQLRTQPLAKAAIEYENGELISINKLDYDEAVSSPLSTMNVEVTPFTDEQIFLDRDDPIKSIAAKYESDDLLFEDYESKILEDFCAYVVIKDPDVVIFSYHDLPILNYLLERIKLLSLDLQFGRRKTDIYSNDQRRILDRWTQGRIYLTKSHLDHGLIGLIELSCFSYLPMKICMEYSIGRQIANRNLYELIGRGHVILDNYNQRTHEQIRTVEEIIQR